MVLEIKNLTTKINGKIILDNLDLATQNKLLAIVGPSGAGKTTFLRCIAGLQNYQGEIYFDHSLINNIPTRQREIGMISQELNLFPHLTVFENIAYPLKFRNKSKKQIRELVTAVLEQFSISQLANKLPQEISGGEKQRVAIARALIYEPKILLMDEPFAHLDVVLRSEILLWFKNLTAKKNTPIFFVTHDIREAKFLGGELLFLTNGKIEFHGSFLDFEQSEKPIIKSFLSKII